ncbi:MAG TPA: PQQ-binding-like beta-propeller repeat protein [Patescibacteria group bacterium]|nr:PQQ-binding-like beta-propeller repeat protein [Patescibacteria group bacterium]
MSATRPRRATWRRRAARVAAGLAAAAMLFGPTIVPAREERSVFHGMPTEPDSAFKPTPSKNPVDITRAWIFDDFRAPLADRLDGDGTRVIAADRSGDVAALAATDGSVVWRVHLGEAMAVGPELEGGRVLLSTTTGAVVALDAVDGSRDWRAVLGATPVAPPMAAGGRLLVATEAPELLALDPATGAVLGRIPLPGRPVPPSLGEHLVIVGTEHGMVVAVDPATLQVRWRRYLRMAVTAPVLIESKRVYVAVADRTLRCLRLSSGKQVWRQRTGAIATASLMSAGEYVYVLCWDDDIYVVRRSNGHLAARVHLDHRLSLDAVRARDYLYVAPFTEGTVVALSLPGLTMAGKFNLAAPGEWFTTPPVMAGERVAVGSGRAAGRILALDVKPAPPKKGAPAAPGPPAAAPEGAPQQGPPAPPPSGATPGR